MQSQGCSCIGNNLEVHLLKNIYEDLLVEHSTQLSYLIFKPSSNIMTRNIVCVIFLLSISQLQMVCCICKGEQYTVKMQDNSTKCQDCGECHAGYGRYPTCGSEVNFPVVSGCSPCQPGTFSEKEDAAPCKKCHQCAQHEKHTSPCTNISDTVCSGTCNDGYYFTKKAPHICQKCSCCFNDGKDEIQKECIEHGLKQRCSVRLDRQCASTAHPSASSSSTQSAGGSNTTLHIILGVVGAVGLVAIVLLITVLCVKKRKQRTVAERVDGLQSVAVVSNVPELGTASASGQPPVVRIVSRENPSYNNSHPGTPDLSTVNSKTVVPNDSRDNPLQSAATGGHGKFARQTSRDSQSSQGENGFSKRKRSSIASGMEMIDDVIRKMSLKKEDSLISEDVLEENCNTQGPEIERHPQSPTVKEGSKVEFTCKVRGKKNVLYEWLKDDTVITGKCDNSLLLDPVKMADFGQYTCCVKYKTNHSSEKSSPEQLDVEPCEGREYKLLSTSFSDIDTREKVAEFLSRYYVCCQKIGNIYGMDSHKITSLQYHQHPEKDVMEFLGTTHPKLTVYDFCKQLKNVKRMDVVEVLEIHLASEVQSSQDE